jgi:hypothetical protein
LQFQAVLGFRLSLLASGCGYVCLFVFCVRAYHALCSTSQLYMCRSV